MSALIINGIERSAGGQVEKIELISGVNVIVGQPNTGKTKWLEMLDYLMAETSSPESSFGELLAQKYQRASADITIGNKQAEIERRWSEPGQRGKVFVDGKPMLAVEFSEFLMGELGLPSVRYHIGSRWPQVGWRTLLRHIYRQQRFWSDLADKQPKPEQHASLAVFLGLAGYLFPESRTELAKIAEERTNLEADRRRFVQVLDDISRELLDAAAGSTLTDEALTRAVAAANQRRSELVARREELMNQVATALGAQESGQADALGGLEREWAELQSQVERYATALDASDGRLADMLSYKSSIQDELARLNRTITAAEVFSPLKVTRCPVCEQSVTKKPDISGHCFLCEQTVEQPGNAEEEDGRVAFEIDRLTAELDEAGDVIEELEAEREEVLRSQRVTHERFATLESRLRPYRAASAAILPPEVSDIDVQIGTLDERVRQVNRIRATLQRRDELAEKIRGIDGRIEKLEKSIATNEAQADLVSAADALSEGMNDYLNLLNDVTPGAWSQGRIDLLLTETSFDFFVGNGRWSNKLGGTMTLYFLLAYHFALLRLTGDPVRDYPGLSIIDLPPQLDEAAVVEMERFIVSPFVELMHNPRMGQGQVILTGSSFEGVTNVNRVELTTVWS